MIIFINFDELNFKTRLSLVSKLPTTIINKILKYMENFKNIVDTLTSRTIEIEPLKSDAEKEIEYIKITKDIPFDASFFND